MWVVVSIMFLYSFFLILASFSNRKHQYNSQCNAEAVKQCFSIVIPFRNEQENLPILIQSFRKILFPQDQIEFIFINDHSTDGSIKVIQDELIDFPFQYHILQQSMPFTGKKYAQLQGVNKAKFELIISTDADCEVPPNWVYQMQHCFNNDIHFVAGNITFSGQGFWNDLLRIESAPLLGITALAIDFKRPIMANGANMAFRKSSYLDVLDKRTDLKQFSSGDDTFLLAAINDNYGPNSIVFNKSNVVITKSPNSLLEFYHQRVRWASKWKAQGTFLSAIPALGIWLFHMMYIIALFTSIFTHEWLLALSLIFMKLVGEFLFILNVFRDFPYTINKKSFIFLTFFYSFYIVFFGLSANFMKYKWKGRVYG